MEQSVLPEDGDGASPRNVVFKRIDAAVRPRRLYWNRFLFWKPSNQSLIMDTATVSEALKINSALTGLTTGVTCHERLISYKTKKCHHAHDNSTEKYLSTNAHPSKYQYSVHDRPSPLYNSTAVRFLYVLVHVY
jgi:hypothetical protein